MAVGQFFATLFATLLGVAAAFKLDRVAETRAEKRSVIQRAKAIVQELEGNEEILSEHNTVVNHFARSNNDNHSDHYTLRSVSTESMGAVDDHLLVEYLSEDTFSELQEVHLETTNLNRLIERLQLEMLHPDQGTIDDSSYGYENWTIVVGYYNRSSEEVDRWGLGVLIDKEGDTLQNKMEDLKEDLEDEIHRLQSDLDQPLHEVVFSDIKAWVR